MLMNIVELPDLNNTIHCQAQYPLQKGRQRVVTCKTDIGSYKSCHFKLKNTLLGVSLA